MWNSWVVRAAIVLCLGWGLAGCGGSGSSTPTSGGGSSSGAGAAVSGTAATGAPVAGVTVTLRDSVGRNQTATTAGDGSFQVNVTGLTAPFLLSVGSGGQALYSLASQSGGTANLTPYTSVVLQSYYKAQGTDVATVFGGTLSSASFPNAQQLALLIAPIVTALQPYLSNASVTQPSQFNLFSTAFTANHTGFDRVLDRTVVSGGLLGFTVDSGSGSTAGAISSTVTLAVTAGGGSALAAVAVNTRTTNGSATSSSQQTVPVGISGTQQSDLAAAQSGVMALFQNLQQLIVSKGASIAAGDVMPYVDPGFLDKGQNQAAFAQQIAQFLASVPAGATFSPSIYRVNQFIDGSTPYLDATVELQVSSGSTTSINFLSDGNDNVTYGMVYKREASGNWSFYGQQTPGDAHVNVTQSSLYDANLGTPNSPTVGLDMQTQVNVSTGALSAASITGPINSLPDCSQNPSPLTQASVTLSKDAGSYNGGDRYDLPCTFVSAGALSGNPPSAGTVYTFHLTRTAGGVVTLTYALNGATTDNGVLTAINGVARATFAAANTISNVAGTTLTLSYTPPATYPVLYSFISAFCQNASEVSGGGGSDIDGNTPVIPAGTNTGSISIPAQCDGAALAGLGISVNFIGVNGERSMVTQNIHH
jgi:hypothetical protein